MKIVVDVVIALAIDFGLSALLVKGICWAFGFTFTWKIAFGVWLIALLLHRAVRSSGS